MAQAMEQDESPINMNNPSSNNINQNNVENSEDNKNNNMNKLKRSASQTSKKMKDDFEKFRLKARNNSQMVIDKSKERLSIEGQLRQARISLQRFVDPKFFNKSLKEDTTIPKWVLKKAKGIVFLSVVKVGFLVAGAMGTGVVIIRKANGGWTGPSSIGTGGLSVGFLAGGSKIDYIMILPDDRAVEQFTKNNQVRLGGELQIAVGPLGREASGSASILEANKKNVKLSVIYSYSHSQGLYGGISLDGQVISVRNDCNTKFYHKELSNCDILNGKYDEHDLPLNEDYDMIIHLLDSYCQDDSIPQQGEKISIDDLNISERKNSNSNNNKLKSAANK